MNKTVMKLIGTATCFSALSVFAASNSAEMKNLENRVTALEQRKSSNGTILPPAGPVLDNDYGVVFDVEFLYLKAHETNTYLAGQNAMSTTTTSPDFIDKVFLKWDMNPGVRAFIGYRPKHDNWEVRATWMYIRSKAHQNFTATPGYYLAPRLMASNVDTGAFGPTSVSARWRQNLNQIDLELSRNCYVSKWLAIRPQASLRTAWLYQDLNYTLYGAAKANTELTYTDITRLSNDFWGIGPRLGLDTKWGLGSGISLFGDASASLLWGFFKTYTSSYKTGLVNYVDAQERMLQHTDIAVIDVDVGIAYDKTFSDNQYHFGFKAGWEHHLFLETNMFGGSDSANGSTTLQGLVLSARFDF